METNNFMLLSRYKIQPAIHLVTDTRQQKDVRLEPRLMKLLCLLAKQPGQLVSREQLVTDIWDDYGGGEAGLNHAISLLRKLFDDRSKKLIETVPTKGYILHAEVTGINKPPQAKTYRLKPVTARTAVYAAVVLLVVSLVYFLLRFQTGAAQATSPEKERSVAFDEVNNGLEETALNTITTIGNDSTVYKLKVVGDRRPEFYINEKLLTPDEMEKHLDLINRVKKKLRERSEYE